MLYILFGNKDDDVFFGLSLGPTEEPVPAITLILPPLDLYAENEDDEQVGTIACVDSLLIFVLRDKEVIRLRSFVLIGVLLSVLLFAT